ncbi:hypothetical protein ACFL21_02585 [Patescibacteria group bacterium]
MKTPNNDLEIRDPEDMDLVQLIRRFNLPKEDQSFDLTGEYQRYTFEAVVEALGEEDFGELGKKQEVKEVIESLKESLHSRFNQKMLAGIDSWIISNKFDKVQEKLNKVNKVSIPLFLCAFLPLFIYSMSTGNAPGNADSIENILSVLCLIFGATPFAWLINNVLQETFDNHQEILCRSTKVRQAISDTIMTKFSDSLVNPQNQIDFAEQRLEFLLEDWEKEVREIIAELEKKKEELEGLKEEIKKSDFSLKSSSTLFEAQTEIKDVDKQIEFLKQLILQAHQDVELFMSKKDVLKESVLKLNQEAEFERRLTAINSTTPEVNTNLEALEPDEMNYADRAMALLDLDITDEQELWEEIGPFDEGALEELRQKMLGKGEDYNESESESELVEVVEEEEEEEVAG